MELDQEKKEGGRTCTPGGDDKEPRKPDASDGDSDGSGGGDDDDVSGTRQPYNCNFCKRGFPTAQALGGHMNVHRKDRARARATGTSSSSSSSSASAARAYEAFVSFTGQGGLHPTAGIAAAAAAFSSRSLHGERAPRELSLFGRGDDDDKEGGDVGDQEDSKDGDEEKEHLDLELRLGGGS